ncbi:MAG: hypothetical protein Q9216_003745 [Gyalolechia sp. 2 TL-2023]
MIRYPSLSSIIFHLLVFTTLTHQVSITLILFPGSVVPYTATCTNILPGICCRFPGTISEASAVNFSHLTPFDIAAVWKREPNLATLSSGRGGCSGRILRSRVGSRQWTWTSPSGLVGDRASGGSYVTLPRTLPPGEKEREWMAVEGLLAMAWGGGEWFASQAAERLLGRSGGTPKSRVRRDIRSSEKGRIFARNPTDEILPDWMEWNQTRFELYNADDMMYRNEEGGLVNLTTLFLSDSD